MASTFSLWSPSAEHVALVDVLASRLHPMYRQSDGTWTVRLSGDCENMVYRFRRKAADGRVDEFTDPVAVAVTANGEAGVVKHLPPWNGVRPPPPAPGAEIIYEAHVRDLTIHPDNGIAHKGKYLGLTEAGTRTAAGAPSGLDYLRSLGVTHIQLLPIFDFATVDETGDLRYGAQYNWGYDPQNYNAPEGSYSTNPHDPDARIDELRQLVDTLHAHGLRVIMDVVYNHVYDTKTAPLALAEPHGYFRLRTNGQFFDGTSCGSETASEHPRMRSFIVDSVTHWARTYGIDGFRFDLMGIHDTTTMRQVREALDDIDPTILVLGEGWAMGHHPPGVTPANYRHARDMPGIGMFNDSLRDVIRGDNFRATGAGFATGAGSRSEAALLYDNLTGARGVRNYLSPLQSVVYTEAHDNLTLHDKIAAVLGPRAQDSEIVRRHQLAMTIQYLAAGRVFIHAGQEFLRTKNGDDNSYRTSDTVNAFDYDRAVEQSETVELFRALNAFRRAHPWTRPTEYGDIATQYELLTCAPGLVAYRAANAWVIINATEKPVGIGEALRRRGKWEALIFDHQIFTSPAPVPGQSVPALSVAVLVSSQPVQRC